jgi:hypothetical protein
MALYKDSKYLRSYDSSEFDLEHKPGQMPRFSGVYICVGCGREIVAEESKLLPPQNHHQHSSNQGAIRWKLIVYADHTPK